MDTATSYACPGCGQITRSLADLLGHLRLLHFGTPGFRTIQCNLDGCRKTFRKYAVYRNHIYEYHSHKISLNVPVSSEENNSTLVPVLSSSSFEHQQNNDQDIDYDNDLEISTHSTECMQRAAAIWVLKVQEVCRLPQSTTEKIMQDVSALYEAALSNLSADVEMKLRGSGVDETIIQTLNSTFSPTGLHGNLFYGLGTHYRQLQYYKSNFNFVVCACMKVTMIHGLIMIACN